MQKELQIKHLPAVSCLPVADDFLACPLAASEGSTFVFGSADAFARLTDWRGVEDFSAKVTFGWNRYGLCFAFDITDSEVINEKEKGCELWMQDCVEVFVAAPDGRMIGNEKKFFERMQLILTPPDEAGRIRSFTLLDSAYAPDIRFDAVGELTEKGYMIRLQIPYEAFGDFDIRREKLFRMQFSCSDYDRRDGETTPCRKAALKRAVNPSASAVDYPLFRVCSCENENPAHSLDLLWNPSVPGMVEEKSLEILLDFPDELEKGELSLRDFSGRELFHYELPQTEKFVIDGLDQIQSTALELVFTGFLNGEACGSVTRHTVSLANLFDKLSAVEKQNLSDNRKIGYLALYSAVEFLRMTAAPGSMNSNRLADAIAECEARLALLADRPLPEGLPEKFRYLELSRNFDAQLNICYNRGGRPSERNHTVVSLPWGNIPCVSVEIFHCSDEQETERVFRSLAAYGEVLPPLNVAGAEQALHVRQYPFCDGLRADLEVERLLSVYSPDRPGQVLRLPLDMAVDIPVAAVCIMPDAPESIREKVKDWAAKNNLPEIAFAERDNYSGTLIAGTPDYPEIARFWHSRNGLPGEFLIVRRGNDVLMSSAAEAGRRFMEFVLAGKPLNRSFAREIALSRMADLPEADAAMVQAARDLRVGDVHTHTIFSDGQTTPASLLVQAPAAGFDFVVISDHDEIAGAERLAENCRKNKCGLTFFIGDEITMAPRYHINVYPVSRRIDERFSWEDIRRQADEMNAVIQLNHPLTYGTAFSEYWYNDLTLAGFDAVERYAGYYEKWQTSGKGKLPVITGSTDTHTGTFGCLDCTVVYAPDFSAAGFAKAIKSGDAAMIDPLMPGLVYGAEHIRRMVSGALADPMTPEYFGKRVAEALADFDVVNWIRESETIPAPFSKAMTCPAHARLPEKIVYPPQTRNNREILDDDTSSKINKKGDNI